MSKERVKKLINQKENIRLEFKESRHELPANLFETICAMLNREGRDILLGVADDGRITGVEEERIEALKTNLVNLSNNPQKLDPPFILFPQTYSINKQTIIHIQVPSSSQVHKSSGVVYDRSNDGDFRVTQPQQIAQLYNRKRSYYTEELIYPALRFEDFKPELFPIVRNLIRSNNSTHPWLTLTDVSLLQVASLWKRDQQTGQEGYTLAAALLFGKDWVIQQILPHYKIDALLRKVNTDRYDDREYIQTNLIEAYDQVMAFVAKHLPDKFFMEGDQRVSLRTKIFREIVANLIVHREYINAHPTTFIIYKDRVETENANNPHGEGFIDPDNFAPFPKNPTIAKFFIQLGHVDELGSGVLNVTKYLKHYSPGKKPLFREGSTFKTIIPLDELELDVSNKINEAVNEAVSEAVSEAVNNLVSKTVTENIKERLKSEILLLHFQKGISLEGLKKHFKIERTTAQRDMKYLKDSTLVIFKGAAKTGKYVLTKKGERLFKK
jgi:ATP-dependent DNA helicase RecG